MTEQAAPQCYRHPGRPTWISCQRCGRPICPDCMVPASVGYQCPSCVNEGKKSVRAPRTAFGGRISGRPELTTMVLIAINAFIWALTSITGGNGSKLVGWFALTPKGTCEAANGAGYWPDVAQSTCSQMADGAHWVAGATDGAPWQLLTAAFMHVEPWHIATNMISLWFLGPGLEAVFGRVRFLAIYFVAALSGSAAVVAFSAPHSPTLGASGAIFGLLGALLLLSRGTPELFGQVVFWLVLNLVLTFTVPGISWQGHIGGLIGGAVMTLIIMNTKRLKRPNRQF